MKENELTKAAKSMAEHFHKAAKHYEKMAEHHKHHAETHEEIAEEHEEMMDHHTKCMGKADVGDDHKVAYKFHKAMNGHHMKKASYHEKMCKACMMHCEECGKAAVGCEEASKAAGVMEPVDDVAKKALEAAELKKQEDAKLAEEARVVEEARKAKEKAELEKAAGGNPDLAKLFSGMTAKFTEGLAAIDKKFDAKFEEFGKQIEPLPSNFKLFGRNGNEVEKNVVDSTGSGL